MLKNKQKLPNPNDYEILMKGAFDLVKGDIQAAIVKASTEESIGRKDIGNLTFRIVSNYSFLIYYCILIRMYILESVNNGRTVTWDIINSKYNLDCVTDTLACRGVKTKKVFDYFGYDKSLFISSNTGIEFMALEIGDHQNTIVFEVKKDIQ